MLGKGGHLSAGMAEYPLRHLTGEQRGSSINNHIFSRKHSETNVISGLLQRGFVGFL